jgi:hypothetical protein
MAQPQNGEHQLGDFIKGRLLFIQEYCKRSGLPPQKTIDEIWHKAQDLAGTSARRQYLEDKILKGVVLATTILPDWLDRVLLESMTQVLKSPETPVYTTDSRKPCVAFEAGRFNAHRQADSVFKMLFEGRTPETWLTQGFRIMYRKCYGDEAAADLKVDEVSAGHYRISMSNRLEKSSPMDCSTIIGYLCGCLEKLGAKNTVVRHPICSTQRSAKEPVCIFEVSWQ